MPVFGKSIVRLLKKQGWAVVSQKGSHVKLEKDGKTTVVPVHGNQDLGKGLVRAIEKQTGEKIL